MAEACKAVGSVTGGAAASTPDPRSLQLTGRLQRPSMCRSSRSAPACWEMILSIAPATQQPHAAVWASWPREMRADVCLGRAHAVERGRWPPEAMVEQSAEAVLGRYYRTAQAWSEWHVHPWLPLLTCPLDRCRIFDHRCACSQRLLPPSSRQRRGYRSRPPSLLSETYVDSIGSDTIINWD